MINEHADISIVEEDLREKLANFCREQHKDCLLTGMVYKKKKDLVGILNLFITYCL